MVWYSCGFRPFVLLFAGVCFRSSFLGVAFDPRDFCHFVTFAWCAAITPQGPASGEVVALNPRSRCWHFFTIPSLSSLRYTSPVQPLALMVHRPRRVYSSSTLPLDRAWVPGKSRCEHESEHPLHMPGTGPDGPRVFHRAAGVQEDHLFSAVHLDAVFASVSMGFDHVTRPTAEAHARVMRLWLGRVSLLADAIVACLSPLLPLAGVVVLL